MVCSLWTLFPFLSSVPSFRETIAEKVAVYNPVRVNSVSSTKGFEQWLVYKYISVLVYKGVYQDWASWGKHMSRVGWFWITNWGILVLVAMTFNFVFLIAV